MVDHVVYLLTSIVTIMKHNCSTQATSGQIPGEVTTGFEICNEKNAVVNPTICGWWGPFMMANDGI